MSKAALCYLILSLMSLVVNQLLPQTMVGLCTVAMIAAALFAGLFVIALAVGRRFKFDPVLRQAKP